MTQLAIGKPAPLGAHYDGQGVNFTLFSAHAERVELCVFDANGQEHRYDLPGHSGDIWHGYLPDARPGLRYGYRVHGPWQPAEGHRFNPAKLLIDPCARQIDGEFKDNPLLHAGHNEPDYRDNAAIAPKCVVVVDHYDWEDDAPPRTPWGSTIREAFCFRAASIAARNSAVLSLLSGLIPKSAPLTMTSFNFAGSSTSNSSAPVTTGIFFSSMAESASGSIGVNSAAEPPSTPQHISKTSDFFIDYNSLSVITPILYHRASRIENR